MTQQPALSDHRDTRRSAPRSRRAEGGIQPLQLRVSVLPAAGMAVLGIAVAAVLLTVTLSAAATAVLIAVACVIAAAILGAAAYGAVGVTRRLHDQLGALRLLSSRSREELQRLAERVQRGERPALLEAEPPPAVEADPFSLLRNDLYWQHRVAEQAVLKAAGLTSASDAEQRVEVFVNLAWRMQSLVHREIQLLDDLEAQVEDPELLKGLFTVDHLATRMRRQSESLAVLGGAVSRRQWTRPVTMHEVLRAAVAEVEQYSRVKVVPPVEGILVGSAVADVIHLVAELVENATKFSAPHTQALLRAQNVTAGLAIEVEDRGLGMLPADRHRMNELLADPGLVNISELLRDGRIGLFVVSSLARRHGIKVQLQANIFGGTQAIVILPHSLIETGRRDREAQPVQAAAPAPVAAGVLPAPSSPAAAPLPVRTPAVSHDPAPGLPGGGQYVTTGDEYHTSGATASAAAAGVTSGATASAAAAGVRPGGEGSGPWPQHRMPAAPQADMRPAGETPGSWPQHHAPAPPVADVPPGDEGSGLWPQHRTPAAPQADMRPAGEGSGSWPQHRAPASPSAGLPEQPEAHDGRPPLPRRQAQANLAPQLREAPAVRRDEPPADQIPGLMAAFQGGFSRAEDEGPTAGD